MIKFYDNFTHILNWNKIILIVGERPSKPKNKEDRLALETSRTGTLIQDVIKGLDNIVLTNAYNYYSDSKEDESKIKKAGREDLKALVNLLEPKMIISLGNVAKKEVDDLEVVNKVHHNFPYPSYMLRFRKDRLDFYAESLQWTIKSLN